MKCFSLIHYGLINDYNIILLRLLRRMSSLEKLTLYLRIASQHAFINPIDLLNEFTMYMSQLNSFNFYLSMENDAHDLVRYLSDNDVKQNYRTIGQKEVLDMICLSINTSTYHIFTVPFEFNVLSSVGNLFPNIVFNYVVDLWVLDVVPFEHEFFQRISKAFPLLENFHITVLGSSVWDNEESFPDVESHAVVEYPHLTLLDVWRTSVRYVEQFLNEAVTHLPCLSELRVRYDDLRTTTNNFIREATRRNCLNVKRLITEQIIVGTRDYYIYFPSL